MITKDFNNNQIVGNLELNDAEIDFKGSNNIFYCVGNIKLENCKVRFTGSNSLVYIDENIYPFSLDMRLGNDSVIYIGKDSYTNKKSFLEATERKNIIIGNQLMLSFGIYFRTADPHILYDIKTKTRVNYSKSILVGDRVWIGQNSLILKNTLIGSGAVIGGNSVVTGKIVPSNSVFAGNPAKKVKEGVFYGYHYSTNDFDENMELDSEYFTAEDVDKYVYSKDDNTLSLRDIDSELMNIKYSKDKIEYIRNILTNNNSKNRFYM